MPSDYSGFYTDATDCRVEQSTHGKNRDRSLQHRVFGTHELRARQGEMYCNIVHNRVEALLDSRKD
jgi:hypothetical protein